MMSSSSSVAHQFSCFSSNNRKRHNFNNHLNHNTLLAQLPNLRSLVCVSVRSDGSNLGISGSQTKTNLSNTTDASIGLIDESSNSYASAEDVNNNETSEPLQEHTATELKKAAKIHDFCLGIPFGGIVLTGGLAGFIFTRNLSTLGTGMLFGGALLVLSTFSLKVWLHGKSNLPFILGQSALALALLCKNAKTYSLSRKLFPSGFYVLLSAAMMCFYSYLVFSGGNPPPERLKSPVVVTS